MPPGGENWCKSGFCGHPSGGLLKRFCSSKGKCRADLIVMGAKPRKSLVGHAPLTIAYNVVTKAACPVLTVRA